MAVFYQLSVIWVVDQHHLVKCRGLMRIIEPHHAGRDVALLLFFGFAQSLARELQPQNIHVGHIVIDGGIAKDGDPRANERGPDGLLDPNAIADTYLALHRQQRSAWAWEIELRPWIENF